jgi:hypothetical protein
MEWHAKQENIHVAHIYPYSMNTVPRDASFWFTLQVFWSMEKIDEWKKALFLQELHHYIWPHPFMPIGVQPYLHSSR